MLEHIGQPPVLASGLRIPLTPAVRAGDLVFLSGQLGLDAAGVLMPGGVAAETRQCFVRIRALLAEIGCGLDAVVKSTVFLARAEDFPAFNAAYAAEFPGKPPARSTVLCGLLVPGASVEIEVIAYAPGGTEPSLC